MVTWGLHVGALIAFQPFEPTQTLPEGWAQRRVKVRLEAEGSMEVSARGGLGFS